MRDVVSKVLTVVIVVVAIFLPLSSCDDLIDNTCKHTPNYQLCVSILRSDPKAPGADVTGLALIMVNSLNSKSSSALKVIEELLKTKPKLKVPLTECSKKYKFVIEYDVSVAIEALLKGNPKFGEDGMNDAGVEIQLCEDGFKPSSSPLTRVNKEAKDVAAIAAAIIRLLL